MCKLTVKLSIVVLLICCTAQAQTINVPEDYATIKEAMEYCPENGTIVIAEGVYRGSGNRNLTIPMITVDDEVRNKNMTITSTDPTDPGVVSRTIIDCERDGRAFAFSGEMKQTVVKGLTIRNGGRAYGLVNGGAILLSQGANPKISNCVITDCIASLGGAIAVENGDGDPIIENCRIIANIGTINGGAFYFNGGYATVVNCIISGNISPLGGAVYDFNTGNNKFSHCTITDNIAKMTNEQPTFGGGAFCFNKANLELYGCILWGNIAIEAGAQMQIAQIGPQATVTATFCDIQGLAAFVEDPTNNNADISLGTNGVLTIDSTCIDTDPMFVQNGVWDANFEVYTEGDYSLPEDSPCIDLGDPAYVPDLLETDVYSKKRVFAEVIDIGAAEFVVEEDIIAKLRLWPKVIN